MKIVEIGESQAIQLFTSAEGGPGVGDAYTLVKSIERRYKFMESPHSLEQFNLDKGSVFKGGIFEGEPVGELVLFDNGALVRTPAVRTERLDAFFVDLANHVGRLFGVPVERFFAGPRLYTSVLVVQSDKQLGEKFERLSSLGQMIAEMVRAQGANAAEYQVVSFTLGLDVTATQKPQGAPFVFERRADHPHSSGLYFSRAPLRTQDHEKVLRQLDEIFS